LHCGACDNACLAGQICEAGTCEATCAAPLVDCPLDTDGDTTADTEICSDLTSDPLNCGTCGTACGMAEACVASTCTGLACLVYRGYASWSQSVYSQSDAVQDSTMDSACSTAFPGSRAAFIDDIVFGCIAGLPSTNGSSRYLLGKCPHCEGRANTSAVSGHCRLCVRPSSVWPTSLTAGWETNCCSSTRSALCVN
jgi:hypothetical protein